MTDISTSLIVRGEQIQALYGQYLGGALQVNRRYQRKLVWSVEEKRSFIDSLRQDLPVPLILVAETQVGPAASLEIIDGLQRLNAVFGFIENEYAVPDVGYFDLNTLAQTKILLDQGSLSQKQPIMGRDECVRLAGYSLPISVYRARSNLDVEEVFRRINSNGRHLSRQEIRQAGSLTNFADLVRSVSASTRGDYSVSDSVDLRRMPSISISSTPEGPGVFVDSIFWVRHKILDREQVRMSRDEEIVADLLASMLVEPVPPYDSRVLDEFYGLSATLEKRQDRIESVIVRDTPEGVKARFDAVLDVFEQLFSAPDVGSFTNHFFTSPKQRVPRYFEAVFLGLDTLLHEENRDFIDLAGARATLSNFGSRHLDIPGGGGTWTSASKTKNAAVVAGVLREFTVERTAGRNPATERNGLLAERLLRASLVESSIFELKQGLSRLTDPPKLDAENVAEVCRTLTAMANDGPNTTGYILIGVSEKRGDAERVETLTGGRVPVIDGRYITGLDVDISSSGSLDKLLLWFTSQMRARGIDARLEAQILRDLRSAPLDGKTILIIKVVAVDEPVAFEGAFYIRMGSQTHQLTAQQLGPVFARFAQVGLSEEGA